LVLCKNSVSWLYPALAATKSVVGMSRQGASARLLTGRTRIARLPSAPSLGYRVLPRRGTTPRRLELDEESHVLSFAAVREWTVQFPVQVG
jgi:hypothetical protein